MSRRDRTLRTKLAPLLTEQRKLAENIQNGLADIEQEANRVASVMENTPQILEDIDRQFDELTGLTQGDTAFLFIAVALQCLRQYVLSSEKFRLSHEQGDSLMEKVVPKKWHDILLASVPYDATRRTDIFKETVGSADLGGTTHRYRTLGHDSVFGWFFGPVNIITDSLTKTDFITTYSTVEVISKKGGKHYEINGLYKNSTIGAINDFYDFSCQDKYLLPVSVIRQALHFGSDYFTKQGLPIPVISSLNNDLAHRMVGKFNIDMYSVTRSAAVSMLINELIKYIHTLFYDETSGINRELYEVRTRKILSYSNSIASFSNIIYVAVSAYFGNKNALKKLDVGGLLVTIYRLVTDYRYIVQLKKEFIEKEYYSIVMDSDRSTKLLGAEYE